MVSQDVEDAATYNRRNENGEMREDEACGDADVGTVLGMMDDHCVNVTVKGVKVKAREDSYLTQTTH